MQKLNIFLVGDYRTGTGPANVTRRYKDGLSGVVAQKMRSKPLRLLELALKIPFCDIVLLSGHSAQNLYAIKIAHIWHKKAAFLMHGCVEHENAINRVPDEKMTREERETLREADAIYAVSTRFASWLMAQYPAIKEKVSAVPNGIDLAEHAKEGVKDPHGILSIGGGMPRKGIKTIAQAVMILRKDPAYADTVLTVIGAKGADSEEIDAYPCVRDLGLVSHERTLELLTETALFVQNSCFETFGLAPLEALSCGASLLLSKEVGALEVFGAPLAGDLIEDTYDASEIAQKMKKLLERSNHDRLLSSIDTESVSWDKRCSLLTEKLQTLANK